MDAKELFYHRFAKDVPDRLFNLMNFLDGAGAIKLGSAVLGACLGYVLPGESERNSAIGAGVLVLFDTITGIIAAKKRKKEIKSGLLGRVLTKVFVYFSVAIVAAVAQATVASGSLPIIVPVLWLIIATEGYSILENVEKAGFRRFSFLRRLLGRVIESDKEDSPDRTEINR